MNSTVKSVLKNIFRGPFIAYKEIESICKYRKHFIEYCKLSLHRKIVYNNNGSKLTFFVVGGGPYQQEGFRHWGLGNIETYILCSCIYAFNKGYVPIVDMKSVPCMYQSEEEKGKVNIWEKYYQQPCGYTLDDLQKAGKVVYSVSSTWMIDDFRLLRKTKKMYHQFIKVREDLRNEVDDYWASVSHGKKNILGCVCRGTDIIGLNWGANYPSVDEIIACIKRVEAQYDYIFIATEDIDMFNRFCDAFGEKLIYVEQKRYSVQKGKYLMDYEDDRENAAYIRGKEYLFAMECLSKCKIATGMLGTATNIASMKNPELKVVPIENLT